MPPGLGNRSTVQLPCWPNRRPMICERHRGRPRVSTISQCRPSWDGGVAMARLRGHNRPVRLREGRRDPLLSSDRPDEAAKQQRRKDREDSPNWDYVIDVYGSLMDRRLVHQVLKARLRTLRKQASKGSILRAEEDRLTEAVKALKPPRPVLSQRVKQFLLAEARRNPRLVHRAPPTDSTAGAVIEPDWSVTINGQKLLPRQLIRRVKNAARYLEGLGETHKANECWRISRSIPSVKEAPVLPDWLIPLLPTPGGTPHRRKTVRSDSPRSGEPGRDGPAPTTRRRPS